MGMRSLLAGVKRVWLPLLVSAIILTPDAGSHVVLFALGVTLIVSAVSHVMRKVLFPYISLNEYADKAHNTPLGAAIVFASVTWILSIIILATCMLLK